MLSGRTVQFVVEIQNIVSASRRLPIGHIGFASVVVLVLISIFANVLDGLLPCNFESGGRHVTVAVVGVILTLQEGVARGKLLFRDQIAGAAVFVAINHIVCMIGEGKQISVAVVNVGILLRAVIPHLCGSAEDVVRIVDNKAVAISHRGQPACLFLIGVGGKATQEMSMLKSRFRFLRFQAYYATLNAFLRHTVNKKPT